VIDLLTDGLAVARLARLAATDRISDPAREWLWDHRHDRLYDLASCEWCTAVWAAIAVGVVRRVAPGWWRPVAGMLAAAEVAGLWNVARTRARRR
jgi:hypothetical protein